jgi:hypothetical protein
MTPISAAGTAAIRRTEEAVQFAFAFPSHDEVVLADGTRMPKEEWLTKRAERSAPTLDERQVATLLARVVERDDHFHVEPERLLITDALGRRQASTAPVRDEIDRARLSWLLLQGLAALVIGAAVLALAVGTRGTQRRDHTRHTWIPFVAFSVVAVIAFGSYVIKPAVHATLGEVIPLPELSWWDQAATWIVGHALAVGAAMGTAAVALVVVAFRNANWLPLVPDSRPRLG